MQTEDYTEQRASRYEPMMWTRESDPVAFAEAQKKKRPRDYRYSAICNHRFCTRTSIWFDRFCAEHVDMYEPKPRPVRKAAARALRSRPAKTLVFVLRWGGAGFLLGPLGIHYWQWQFYAVLIPLCLALSYVADWQRKGA